MPNRRVPRSRAPKVSKGAINSPSSASVYKRFVQEHQSDPINPNINDNPLSNPDLPTLSELSGSGLRTSSRERNRTKYTNLNFRQIFRQAHRDSDVDKDGDSLHHTLGTLRNQAARGNHKHFAIFNTKDYKNPQDAINAAQDNGGGIVHFSKNVSLLGNDDPLIVTSDNIALWAMGAVIDGTSMDASVSLSDKYAIKVYGSKEPSVSVTVSVAVGDTNITVSDSSVFNVGDLVEINSDENYEDGAVGSYGNRGALHKVKEVPDATHVVLTEGSFFAYDTAQGARIFKVNPLKGFSAMGLDILMGGEGKSHSGMQLEYLIDPYFHKVTFDGCEDTSLQMRTVYRGHVTNSVFKNSTSGAFGTTGYGVSVVHGCRDILIDYCEFENCRHGITGGGSPVSIYIKAKDCTAIDMLAGSFDCHEECFWWEFDNCKAFGSLNTGFAIRGQYTRLINCEARDIVGPGAQIKSFDVNSDGLKGTEIINFRTDKTDNSSILWEGTVDCPNIGGIINGHNLNNAGTNHITIWYSHDLVIGEGVYDGIDSTAGAGDGNNVRIVGSVLGDCSNIIVKKSVYRNTKNRFFRADFVDGLIIAGFIVEAFGTATNFLNSCQGVQVTDNGPSGSAVGNGVVTTDATFTLNPLVSPYLTVFTPAMAANRVVTLGTANAYIGCKFKIVHKGSGFNLHVGSGPLKVITPGTYVEVMWIGAAWTVIETGAAA